MRNVKKLSFRTLPLPESVATSLEDALTTATEKVDVFSDDARAMAAKLEKQVRSAAGRLNFDVERARREARKMADDLTKRVGGTVDTFVSEALHRFNVPTRRELKELTAKVDVLGRKIDGLRAARARRAPMKRGRRAA